MDIWKSDMKDYPETDIWKSDMREGVDLSKDT